MFDMSWSELLLIAVVALIVIGPKDLPKVLKTLAQLARKAREMAREFQSGLEEMAREAELHEVKKEIERTASTDLAGALEHSIDPGGTLAKSLDLQAEAAAITASGPAAESGASEPAVEPIEPPPGPAEQPAPVVQPAGGEPQAAELADPAAPTAKP